MENVIEPSVEGLLRELKKRAKNELVVSAEAFEDLVDELLDEKTEWGELNEDDDTQTLREDLIGRWPEVDEYVRENEKTRR